MLVVISPWTKGVWITEVALHHIVVGEFQGSGQTFSHFHINMTIIIIIVYTCTLTCTNLVYQLQVLQVK